MSLSLFDLSGKTALVTGGTHGIGLAIGQALAEAGAQLVINGHTPEKLDKAVEACHDLGLQATGYLFDITDEKAVTNQINKISGETGPVDILVNNAAIHRRVPLNDLSMEVFREVIDVNLTAQFGVARVVAQGMIERKAGKIINICSMMSELGRHTTGAYAAAKGGLKMLTRAMATEWAAHGIQANGIGPGYIKTDATGPISDPEHPLSRYVISRTPAGRWGSPDDLKGAAVFLASRASDFVNGHILYVDGGILSTFGNPDQAGL